MSIDEIFSNHSATSIVTQGLLFDSYWFLSTAIDSLVRSCY